jgi:hypothetical protein
MKAFVQYTPQRLQPLQSHSVTLSLVQGGSKGESVCTQIGQQLGLLHRDIPFRCRNHKTPQPAHPATSLQISDTMPHRPHD